MIFQAELGWDAVNARWKRPNTERLKKKLKEMSCRPLKSDGGGGPQPGPDGGAPQPSGKPQRKDDREETAKRTATPMAKRGREDDRDPQDEPSHDEEGTVLFQLPPTDTTNREKAIVLLRQVDSLLGEPDEDEIEGDAEDEGDEPVYSDTRACIRRQAAALEKELSCDKDGKVFSWVMLGRNGDGKSFLANILISATCHLSYGYPSAQRSAAGTRADKKLRQRLVKDLEGVQYLMDTLRSAAKDLVSVPPFFSSCCALSPTLFCGYYGPDICWAYRRGLQDTDQLEDLLEIPGPNDFTKDQRDKEMLNLEKFDQAWKQAPDGEKSGFVLPSAAGEESTTQFSIRARFSEKVWHLVIIYKTEEELRREIYESDFVPLEDCAPGPQSPEGKQYRRIRKIKRLIAGCACTTQCSSTQCAPPPLRRVRRHQRSHCRLALNETAKPLGLDTYGTRRRWQVDGQHVAGGAGQKGGRIS